MDEMGDLLVHLGLDRPTRRSYALVFAQATGLDPHIATDAELLLRSHQLGLQGTGHARPVLLDFLFSMAVMPGLGIQCPEFIDDFPACQAALARLRAGVTPVAERFELFINGVEIANGFHELTSVTEQRARFEADNRGRQAQGREPVAMDEHLLSALAHGLPDCAGVALGIDRLFMQILGYDSIDKVVTFTYNQA
jgi:lysyl-tRNA synthetase class 2